jgi:hypothetical protein
MTPGKYPKEHIQYLELIKLIRAEISDAEKCVPECTFLWISWSGNYDVRILDIQKFCISFINVSV